MVELAIVLIPFFVLVFGVIDFSWALFNQINAQDAVREAGRYASTGNHATDSKGNAIPRTTSIVQVLDGYAIGSGVSIQQVQISSVYGGTVNYNEGTGKFTGTGNAGAAGDTVTITATCAVPMLTAFIGKFFATDLHYHFTASSTFKNEPFLPASQF
jgi:Flp pilus assembly protein TadG